MTTSSPGQTAYNYFIQRWDSFTLNVVRTPDRGWQNPAAELYRDHSAGKETSN